VASKRRIRKRSCASKVRHETAAEAGGHIRDLRKRDKDGPHRQIYKCRFCGGYHVGRENRSQRQGRLQIQKNRR